MKIRIYAIAKKQNQTHSIVQEIRQFRVDMEIIDRFNNDIQKAQRISPKSAQCAYTRELEKYIDKNALNIALHPRGEELDSHQFSDMLRDKNYVNFFIAGAFGFEDRLLSQMKQISLSKLTFSHTLAKTILCEQIFRALCIIHNHPYHKN